MSGWSQRLGAETGRRLATWMLTLRLLTDAPRGLHVSISPKDGVVEGKTAVLSCEGDANPPIFQYTWFDWNNQDIHHYHQTLKLDPVTVQHSGAYWCQGVNQLGRNHSPPSTLTVHCKAPSLLFSGPGHSCGFPPAFQTISQLPPCPFPLPPPSLPLLLCPVRSKVRLLLHTQLTRLPSFLPLSLSCLAGVPKGCPLLPDFLSSYWLPLSASVSHP